jgi:hypothetical protein
MTLKNYISKSIRGWLPKEPLNTYSSKASKPRWRKPYWIALTSIVIVGLAFGTYTGLQAYLRYSSPQLDVTASYYEKTLNCSIANVGNIVEVNVLVGWHGFVIPEFKREVKIVDPYPENNFKFVGGNNTYGYNGYGSTARFTYLLEVISDGAVSVELPKPRLYLDGSEIPLRGTSAVIEIQTVSKPKS